MPLLLLGKNLLNPLMGIVLLTMIHSADQNWSLNCTLALVTDHREASRALRCEYLRIKTGLGKELLSMTI